MKKEIISVGSIGLIMLAAIFIPLHQENYNNQTIILNGSTYSNLNINKFFEIKSYMIINDKINIAAIDRIFRSIIHNFLIIKNIDFPKYNSEDCLIETYMQDLDRISNFTCIYKVEYNLNNDTQIQSKIMNITGQIIFRSSKLDNPEIHINFGI